MLVARIESKDILMVEIRVVNLDASVAPGFRSEMSAFLSRGRPVVLDMTGVEFADSSGLGTLCALNAQFGPWRLVLACITERLATILERLPRHRLPRRFRSVDEAMQSLASDQTAEGSDGFQGAPRLSLSPAQSGAEALACLNALGPDVNHD